MADVLVVGAGPVGLTLAIQLARAGVAVRIIEALPEPLPYCRAIGVTPRTLEIYEDMGVAQQMIDAGLWLRGTRVCVAGMPDRDTEIDLSDLPYAGLGVPQGETERILARHLAGLGVAVERGVRLVSFAQESGAVEAQLEGPGGAESVRTRFLVGCDGAHSTVRKALGIAFEGEALPMPFGLGDVHLDWPAQKGLPRGIALRALRVRGEAEAPDLFIAIPLPEHGRYRVSILASEADAPGPSDAVAHGIQSETAGPTLADLQAAADLVLPDPPRVSDLRWTSRFRISMRLAEHYGSQAAFIAGDAAHIHPPTGGQGMNTGIQDAYNLAWKLALVIEGIAAPALLDSYEAERRPIAEEVIAQTVEETMTLGRPKGPPDRLAHTQMRVNYRGSPLVCPAAGDGALQPGDRAPDAGGLAREGLGFPLRLFELLRGIDHVLLMPVADEDALRVVERQAASLAVLPLPLRMIAIAPAGTRFFDPVGVTLVRDEAGGYAAHYGSACWLVRPDGYLAWSAPALDVPSLRAMLAERLRIDA